MTVTADARDVLSDLKMGRADARVAAKSLAQGVIDDSASTQTPLTGVVYVVSGLYNEGTPECTFTIDEAGDIVFVAKFRAENGAPVTKRQHVSRDTLRSIVDDAPPGHRA